MRPYPWLAMRHHNTIVSRLLPKVWADVCPYTTPRGRRLWAERCLLEEGEYVIRDYNYARRSGGDVF